MLIAGTLVLVIAYGCAIYLIGCQLWGYRLRHRCHHYLNTELYKIISSYPSVEQAKKVSHAISTFNSLRNSANPWVWIKNWNTTFGLGDKDA